MQTQTEKDIAYLLRAVEVSSQTDDPKAKVNKLSGVGTVIVLGKDVIAQSANRIPEAIHANYELDDPNSELRYHIIEHSERSALYGAWKSGKSPIGSTLYCTRFPCSDCARAIIISGVKRLVVPAGNFEDIKWKKSQEIALKMLRNAGTTVRYLTI